ncbi:MAG: competence/damage-inducible protein A [Ruminococcaceae bacterium]|nr:competence/damage-inducible protein A [Oscillospiraceae bacterium]
MKAEIIAVGTELLVGDILNTNAQFLSRRLFALGIDVYYQTVVGDNPDRLTKAVSLAFSRADTVIFSGGLGPTDDDLTKETVASYFGVPLLFHEEIAEQITSYLHRPCSESNKKQAYIPEGAFILENKRGTAPGVILEHEGKTAILLPGPPRELLPMFSEMVEPYLKARSGFVMAERMVRLFGIGESSVGDMIRDLMESANPSVAPYAKDSEVTLRIAAKAQTQEEAEALIKEMHERLKERLGAYIYGYDEQDMVTTTAALLLKKGLTIACAESCTAGLLAGALGNIPGISACLNESVVTYSNEAKIKYLGVLPETLSAHGAVSRQTAGEMAEGIRKTAGADVGVSITGIAGPDGGTPEKPVGLVYVGVSIADAVTVRELHLIGTREKIRQAAVLHALNEIRTRLLAET